MKLRPRNPDYYYGGDDDDVEEYMTKKAASVAMNLMLMAPPSTGREATFPGHAAPAAELLLDFNFSNNNTTNGADLPGGLNMHSIMGGREEYETNENHPLNLQLFHNHLGHDITASNSAGVQAQPLFPQKRIKPPQAVKGKKSKAPRVKKPVKLCPHGKRKQFCVPCDGSQICIHKRFRFLVVVVGKPTIISNLNLTKYMYLYVDERVNARTVEARRFASTIDV